MSSTFDPELLKAQYKDGGNLDARIALHARFSTATQNFHDWLFDHMDVPTDARILELGCGTGQMWKTVQERVPESWRVTFHGVHALDARGDDSSPER